MDRKLEQQFRESVEEWKAHCERPEVELSSLGTSLTDCDAYRNIVAMGREALPLIRKLYDTDKDFSLNIIRGHGLVRAVKDIVGEDFQIPREMLGKIEDIEKYTASWLDNYMAKFPGEKK